VTWRDERVEGRSRGWQPAAARVISVHVVYPQGRSGQGIVEMRVYRRDVAIHKGDFCGVRYTFALAAGGEGPLEMNGPFAEIDTAGAGPGPADVHWTEVERLAAELGAVRSGVGDATAVDGVLRRLVPLTGVDGIEVQRRLESDDVTAFAPAELDAAADDVLRLVALYRREVRAPRARGPRTAT